MTSPIESETPEAVLQDIMTLIQTDVGAADLTADSRLLDGGLDSLKVLSLVFKIERRYAIVLEDENGVDPQTIGELAALVVRRIQERP